MKQTIYRWAPTLYAFSMAILMLGYVRYDPYHPYGDSISYMDIASAMLHGRWRDIVNGLWNPGYPALLALGKLLTHADRFHELHVFYWVNYCIFIFSILCTTYLIRALVQTRRAINELGDCKIHWAVQSRLLYLLAYAVVFISWQQEYSLGNILVDPLFASLFVLAFGIFFQALRTRLYRYHIALGITLGFAYLVKSTGLVLGIAIFGCLFIAEVFLSKRPMRTVLRLASGMVALLVVISPYVVALSIQKGRISFGESARLNYAWQVAGTEMYHLLPDQTSRFGNSSVKLKHPEVELLSDPVVVGFSNFKHATYALWFDPSYYNDGISPHFSILQMMHAMLRGSRKLLRFIMGHPLPIVLFFFFIVEHARIHKSKEIRLTFLAVCIIASLNFAMFLPFFLLPRYVAGAFWIFLSSAFALMAVKPINHERRQALLQGAIWMFVCAVMLSAAQDVFAKRQTDIVFFGNRPGWNDATELGVAQRLRQIGITGGQQIACFECFYGEDWLRLAKIHITSEIYDSRYMPDGGSPNQIWDSLPNKPEVYAALRGVGAKGIVGRFDRSAIGNRGLAAAGRALLLDAVNPDCFAGFYSIIVWFSSCRLDCRRSIFAIPAPANRATMGMMG